MKQEIERELHGRQLVAISTASTQNTVELADNRLGSTHLYWTQAYADVCAAVNREMRERERAEKAEAACAEMRDWINDTVENCSVFKDAPAMDAGTDYIHRDKVKGLVDRAEKAEKYCAKMRDIVEKLRIACGSGMNWMEQVDRAVLSSSTRGILHVDMGMCSSAIHFAKQALAEAKEVGL